jgi:hypothetical protein
LCKGLTLSDILYSSAENWINSKKDATLLSARPQELVENSDLDISNDIMPELANNATLNIC